MELFNVSVCKVQEKVSVRRFDGRWVLGPHTVRDHRVALTRSRSGPRPFPKICHVTLRGTGQWLLDPTESHVWFKERDSRRPVSPDPTFTVEGDRGLPRVCTSYSSHPKVRSDVSHTCKHDRLCFTVYSHTCDVGSDEPLHRVGQTLTPRHERRGPFGVSWPEQGWARRTKYMSFLTSSLS